MYMDNAVILTRIGYLRSTFDTNFENPWIFLLLEGLPLDPILLKEIRDFLRIHEPWAVDEQRAFEGLRNLEIFILTLRRYLLPCIKEKLRISYLRPDSLVRDPDQRAIRGLIAYTMPYKVAILDDMVRAFKKDLITAKAERFMTEFSA